MLIGFPHSTLTKLNLLQYPKASSPMLVTLLGMEIEVRLEQFQKAELPMLVTLLGMEIEVRLEQLEKA